MVRYTLVLTASLAAAAVFGCGAQQTAPSMRPTKQISALPLPFKGRLVNGNPEQLPPALAISLSKNSPVEFFYREELVHDEHHVSLLFSAFDPTTYEGAPLGEYRVTAFASLSITMGDKILGNYTAIVRVSEPYSLYREPTHMELDRRARTKVRNAIDQKLYRDENRLANAIASRDRSKDVPSAR